MPRLDGVRTFAALKKINPDFACIFMTGYAIEAKLLDIATPGGTICLRKPFEDIKQIEEKTVGQ